MSPPIRVQAVSWSQFDRLAHKLASAVRASGFEPDVVVAIARGGFVPARILCDYLGVMELASFRIEHYRGQDRKAQARVRHPLSVEVAGRSVLIVDDLSDTGETFEVAVHYLQSLRAAHVRTAALHHKQQSRFEPDYCAQRIRAWRWLSYPWARIEDVTALARGLEQPWGSPAEVAAKLRSRHGLRVSAQTVADVLARLEGKPQP
jgi:hypoxanthine phosphoribosyltransferase